MNSTPDQRVYSVRVHLYPSGLSQSRFYRGYQRICSVACVDHARHRARLGDVPVFDFYRDARTCLVCVRLHAVPCVHRHGCLTATPA